MLPERKKNNKKIMYITILSISDEQGTSFFKYLLPKTC